MSISKPKTKSKSIKLLFIVIAVSAIFTVWPPLDFFATPPLDENVDSFLFQQEDDSFIAILPVTAEFDNIDTLLSLSINKTEIIAEQITKDSIFYKSRAIKEERKQSIINNKGGLQDTNVDEIMANIDVLNDVQYFKYVDSFRKSKDELIAKLLRNH